MRASHDTYEKVAENCSEFTPCEQKNTMTSSTQNDKGNVSCERCHHFDPDEYCRLDIYDKIVSKFNDSSFY